MAAVGAVLAAAAAGCGDDLCDPSSLQAALDGARPGDTIDVASCGAIRGAFRVPSGVTLHGGGADRTVIVSSGASAAIDVVPGEAPTRLSALGIEVSGGYGARASGAGALELRDVRVSVSGGVGISVRDADALELVNVSITGPITRATANSLGPGADLAGGATYGLVLTDVGAAAAPVHVDGLTIAGMGPWGALFFRSYVEWSGGEVRETVGTGVYIEAGALALSGVTIHDMLQGLQTIPSYGVAAVAGATLETTSVSIADGEGLALLQDAASGSHADVQLSRNRFGGVWVQNGSRLEVTGAGSLVDANGLAGIAAVDAGDVAVRDARVRATVEQLAFFGERGTIRAADGIELHGLTGTLELTRVTLEDNARVGALLDVGMAPLAALTLSSVTASGTGAQLGVVAQDVSGVVAPGGAWDSGVTRLGATATNDMTLAVPLVTLAPVAAGYLPVPARDVTSP